jgi:hypothetical protein
MLTMERDLKRALALRRLKLPGRPRVERVEFTQIIDSIGDPALRVTVVLDEATSDEERQWARLAPIAEAVRRALAEAEIDLWPYIRFRKASEQALAAAEQ